MHAVLVKIASPVLSRSSSRMLSWNITIVHHLCHSIIVHLLNCLLPLSSFICIIFVAVNMHKVPRKVAIVLQGSGLPCLQGSKSIDSSECVFSRQ